MLFKKILPITAAGILAIGLSALFQGRAGAAACDAQAETNQGFTNYLAALGIVETVAIFAMVFSMNGPSAFGPGPECVPLRL